MRKLSLWALIVALALTACGASGNTQAVIGGLAPTPTPAVPNS